MATGAPDDPYSRVSYRRLVAWPERIERERPFLTKVLLSGPSRRVLDLGCGTGEHARFLASLGFEVVGVDVSAEMLETARGEGGGPDYVEADLSELADRVSGSFGGAICLGNTLPHLTEGHELERFLNGLQARLEPGAPFLLQVLNYERIFSRQERHLPVNFRPHDDGTIVFLRLMEPRDDGTVLFNPTTLLWKPGSEPPVTVMASRNVTLRGWRRDDLAAMLVEAELTELELFGGMREEPFDAASSTDLVIVARA